MITYRKYNPEKDVLEKNTRIRLAGREARITVIYSSRYPHRVDWCDEENADCLNLAKCPDLEIAEEPLTISRRLKEEIKAMYMVEHKVTLDRETGQFVPGEDSFIKWLDSLEETE